MFGLLFFLFVGICYVIAQIIRGYEDWQFSRMTPELDKKRGYYTDSRGCTRDIKTEKPVMVLRNNQEQLIMYSTRGKELKNISEERSQIEFDKVKSANDGRTVARYEGPIIKEIRGKRYKDLENEKIYVIRKFEIPYNDLTKKKTNTINGSNPYIYKMKPCKYLCGFYMDIDNAHLVRETDESKKFKRDYTSFKITDEEIERFIVTFNQERVAEFYSGNGRNYFNEKTHCDEKEFDQWNLPFE